MLHLLAFLKLERQTDRLQTEYKEDLPQFMTKDHLADQCVRFAHEFDLNVLLQTIIKSITFDSKEDRYTVVLSTPKGDRTVLAKHVVQATGVGSSLPYQPKLDNNEAVFKGMSLHSASYKNPKDSLGDEAKKIIIVGTANTGFDIMEDCYKAGKEVTMIQRSRTYVVPTEYFFHPTSVGLYNILPVELVDNIYMGGPLAVGSQLLKGSHNYQASLEPHRYDKLAAAGFQVEAKGDLMHHLLERCGGHYVDMGATALIADGKVGIKSGVYPVSYVSNGLILSDGTTLEADAIVWCTGFADKNLKGGVSRSVLGDSEGALAIAEKMDATWQLDREGEVRGLFKRQLNVPNYWIFGGFASFHRYYSRVLALQLKGALEGILPDAYRETPVL